MFKPEFQFVVNDAQQARKTVRKHVMREFRRRERWENGDNKRVQGVNATTKGRRNAPIVLAQSESPSSSSPSVGAASPWSAETEGKSEASPETLPDHSRQRDTPENERDTMVNVAEKVEDVEVDAEINNALDDDGLRYRVDPWAAVARSQVDPFSKIKFDVGPATQALLHHFAWVMPSIMDEMVTGTNFHRIGWLYSCVAVHDPTPVHVILGFTLAHIAQLHGTNEPPLAIEHKQQALKLIKERMEDPVEAVNDGSIGSVVNIVGYELVDSNPQGFATHMTGIFRMSKERGGMATMHGNPDLEDVILRLDVLRAYIAISNPRYPDYAVVRSLEPLAINIPPKDSDWCSVDLSANDRREVYMFCEDSIYLIHELEDFMLLVGSAARTTTEELESKNTSNSRSKTKVQNLIQRSATQLLCRPELGNPCASRLPRKCCRLAALIFVDLAIKELFDSPHTSGQFVHVLKSRLLGIMTPWGSSLEMLVMVLIKHDRMALEQAWRAWYIADVVTMTMNFAEESWSIAEQKMLEFIWQDALSATPGLRSSLVWDMQTMVEVFINEWG
ncbi:hypothetical protein MMC13_003612 [Lambiella insularis]|nr:hypothetical protein [Lambiella insularis]